MKNIFVIHSITVPSTTESTAPVKVRVRSNKSIIGQQKGFTLVELLISMIIFLIVTAAIFGVLQTAKYTRERINTRSDTLKNTRLAINLFGRDAVNAGFGYTNAGAFVPNNIFTPLLNIPANTDPQRDYLSSVVVGNNVNPNTLSGTNTDSVSFVWRDTSFNNNQDLTVTDVTAVSVNTPRLTLQTANTTVRPGDLFLFQDNSAIRGIVMVSNVANGGQQLDFAPSDALGVNQDISLTNANTVSVLRKCNGTSVTANCSNYPGSLKKITWINYYVDPTGVFMRRTFGNNSAAAYNSPNQIVDTPIAFGVDNLQLSYLLDDGTVTDDPLTGPDGIRNTADDSHNFEDNIRQITITISVRGPEIDPQTRLPIRIRQTTVFATRNITYDVS